MGEPQFQPGDTVDLVRLFKTASIQMVLLAEHLYTFREVVDRADLPLGESAWRARTPGLASWYE